MFTVGLGRKEGSPGTKVTTTTSLQQRVVYPVAYTVHTVNLAGSLITYGQEPKKTTSTPIEYCLAKGWLSKKTVCCNFIKNKLISGIFTL